MTDGAPVKANSEFSDIKSYVTPFGMFIRKTSIDELPQLINIIKGEMSFIGPRPLAITDEKVLRLRRQNGGDQVLPGISGLAQVNGRNNITDEDKAAYDAKYASHVSARVDSLLVMETFISIVKRDGIFKLESDNRSPKKNCWRKIMINKPSDISVSIVTFNNIYIIEKRLIELLNIFKLSKVSKVFIVDNASTDGTADFIKNIAQRDKLIEPILLNENRGFGFGHNQAIALSNSKYHLIMNLDATPKTNETISKMVEYMNQNYDINLLSPLVRFPDGSIQFLTRNEPTVFDLGIRFMGSKWFPKRQNKFVHRSDGYDHKQIIRNATGSFMLFRLKVLQEIGGFDERYFLYMEDTDITKSINQNGKAIFSPDFEIVHEWQRRNHSASGAKLMLKSMIKYFNKWGWKLW